MTRSGGVPRKPETGVGRELVRFARGFDPHLVRFLRAHVHNAHSRRQVLYGVSLSGTRERAFFSRLASEVCGVPWRQALPLAVAAECFIASAFVADDVMDRAETRWSKPAVWVVWGKNQAWLTAELLNIAGHIALESVQPASAASCLRRALLTMTEGQALQISRHSACSKRETIALARNRTGEFVEACFWGPSLLGGGKFMTPLRTIGSNFGIALQLADDVLDFIGDEQTMGKPILHDLLNGQPNIVLAHALSGKSTAQSHLVARWLGKGTHNHPARVAPIIRALEELGSIDYGRMMVTRYLKKANEGVLEIPEGRARRLLKRIVDPALLLPIGHGR